MRRAAWWSVLGVAGLLAGCAGGGGARTGSGSGAERGVELGELGPAARVEPTPVVLSTEDWSFAGKPGRMIRTPNYRIYTTERDERLCDRMAELLEHALAQYRSGVTTLPAPTSKLDVYLMDNRDQWETLTKRLMGAQASALGHIERGGYAARGIGVYYDLGLYDTLAIASHEGWHQYTQRVFRDPLPVWLEEGMATFMEGHRWEASGPRFLSWANVERFDRLRDAVQDGRVIPLSRLVAMRPQDQLAHGGDGVLDFYAHVWAAAHFLHEGEDGKHRQSLERLLRDAADGRVRHELEERLGWDGAREALGRRGGGAVFEAYVGQPVEALDVAFEAFCREVVRTGSRESIARGVSPVGR